MTHSAMNFLQISHNVSLSSAELAERDPHGIIVTIVSVTVVLLSLLLLFLAYLMIGRIVQKCERKPKDKSAGKKAPTGRSHQYDSKDNIITIKRQTGNEPLTLSRKTVKMTRGLLDVYGIEPESTETVSQASVRSNEDNVTGSSSGTIKAPLPGTIISVKVDVGDKVSIGQEIAVLEAMKMENSLESEYEGTVTAIHINTGESVLEGSEIITIG